MTARGSARNDSVAVDKEAPISRGVGISGERDEIAGSEIVNHAMTRCFPEISRWQPVMSNASPTECNGTHQSPLESWPYWGRTAARCAGAVLGVRRVASRGRPGDGPGLVWPRVVHRPITGTWHEAVGSGASSSWHTCIPSPTPSAVIHERTRVGGPCPDDLYTAWKVRASRKPPKLACSDRVLSVVGASPKRRVRAFAAETTTSAPLGLKVECKHPENDNRSGALSRPLGSGQGSRDYRRWRAAR